MLFFVVCATIWAFRVPVENGVPISFNSDEPSHFLVTKYISEHWALPPYKRTYYESAHPPLSDFIQAAYMRLWPSGSQVFALRFFSTLLGLLTLFVIYKTARLLVSPWSAALATCLVASLPMFVMFSASVTNDSLAVLISCSSLHLVVKAFKESLDKKQLNVLCLLVGLAGIAKYTLLGLIPVTIGTVIYERKHGGKNWIVPVLSILATFVLLSGWWYLRNQMIYGDPFRSRAEAEMAMFTGSAVPGNLGYWISVVTTMTGSFLGLYPTFPIWPTSVYSTVTALFGLLILAAIVIAVSRRWTPLKVALASYALLNLGVVLAYQINHFQPHGRLLAPSILVIALGALNLRHVIPIEKRAFAGTAAALGMACLCLALVTSPI